MRRVSTSFIPQQEEADFRNGRRHVQRDMVELPSTSTVLTPLRRTPMPGLLSQRLSHLRRDPQTRAFAEVACVEVRGGDGMSWSAEAVARQLEAEHSAEHTYRLQAGVAAPPLITTLLGESVVLRAAERARVVRPQHSLRSPRTWGLVGVWLTLVAAGLVGTELVNRRISGDDERDTRTEIVVLVLGVALAGLAGQVIQQRITTALDRSGTDALAGRLGEQPLNPEFHDRLARRLAMGPFPRYVVVDNWERMDATTREVIRAYFGSHYANRRGAEFWVVFEGSDGDRLSNDTHFKPSDLRRGETAEGRPAVEAAKPVTLRLFRQSYLIDSERQQLATYLGDRNRADFTRVRDICGVPRQGDELVSAVLTGYRARHPASGGPDALELFYLIALGQECSPGGVRRDALRDTLFAMGAGRPDKRAAWLSSVLQPFVGELPLGKNHLEGVLDEVQRDFRRLMSTAHGASGVYRVAPDTVAVLESSSHALGLPRAEKGRLFWTLAQNGQLQKAGNDAAVIRGLALTALRTDPLRVDRRQMSLHTEFMDAVEAITRACVPACLFREAGRLYKHLCNHCGDAQLTDRAAVRTRLLRLGWELYSLLGDDVVLAAMLDLPGAAPRPAARRGTRSEQPLLSLAVEMAAIPDEQREQLFELAAARGGDGRLGSPTVADFLRARTAWISLLVMRRAWKLEGMATWQALRTDAAPLELFDRACGRLEREQGRKNGRVQPLDAAAASLALWSAAERLAIPTLWMPPGDEDPTPALANEQLAAMLNGARRAVAAARAVWPSTGASAGGAPDFVANGFAKELCAVALATTLTSADSLRRATDGWEPTPEALDEVRALCGEVERVLGFSVPPFADARELCEGPEVGAAIDSLLRLCSLMWRHFGMIHWSDLLSMRRLQFVSGVIRDETEREARLRAISSPLQASGLAGVAANLAAAEANNDTGEVCAFYAAAAVRAAANDGLGTLVRADLALLAIRHAHSYCDADLLEPAVSELLPASGPRPLDAMLATTSGQVLGDVVLCLYNTARDLRDGELTAALEGALRARAERVEDPEARQYLEELRELHTLYFAVQRGEPVPLPEIFARWKAKETDSWMYADVLQHCIRGRVSPELVDEAFRLFDTDPTREAVDGKFKLAMHVGRLIRADALPRHPEMPRLVALLREGVQRWESIWFVEDNLAAYRVLHAFDTERSYTERLFHWEAEKLERDHLIRFPALARAGRQFLIFSDYARSMSYWGLPAWPSDLVTRLNAPEEEQRAALDRFLASGEVLPPAVVQRGGSPAVGTEFVALGSYLFSSPHVENLALDAVRTRFNRAAELELPALLHLLLDLPSIPARVRDLLRDYTLREEREPDEEWMYAAAS